VIYTKKNKKPFFKEKDEKGGALKGIIGKGNSLVGDITGSRCLVKGQVMQVNSLTTKRRPRGGVESGTFVRTRTRTCSLG